MPIPAAVAAAERLWAMGFPFSARQRFRNISLHDRRAVCGRAGRAGHRADTGHRAGPGRPTRRAGRIVRKRPPHLLNAHERPAAEGVNDGALVVPLWLRNRRDGWNWRDRWDLRNGWRLRNRWWLQNRCCLRHRGYRRNFRDRGWRRNGRNRCGAGGYGSAPARPPPRPVAATPTPATSALLESSCFSVIAVSPFRVCCDVVAAEGLFIHDGRDTSGPAVPPT